MQLLLLCRNLRSVTTLAWFFPSLQLVLAASVATVLVLVPFLLLWPCLVMQLQVLVLVLLVVCMAVAVPVTGSCHRAPSICII
jgi:hypothetical protein